MEFKEILTDIVLPLIITIMASSSFWLFLTKRFEKKSLQTNLLIGLAHDRIVWLGMYYVNRGSISQDEYENLNDYLWKPYKELGGNGTAERVMDEVKQLPMRRHTAPLQRNLPEESKEN